MKVEELVELVSEPVDVFVVSPTVRRATRVFDAFQYELAVQKRLGEVTQTYPEMHFESGAVVRFQSGYQRSWEQVRGRKLTHILVEDRLTDFGRLEASIHLSTNGGQLRHLTETFS